MYKNTEVENIPKNLAYEVPITGKRKNTPSPEFNAWGGQQFQKIDTIKMRLSMQPVSR